MDTLRAQGFSCGSQHKCNLPDSLWELLYYAQSQQQRQNSPSHLWSDHLHKTLLTSLGVSFLPVSSTYSILTSGL